MWFGGQTTILEVEIAAIQFSSPTDWMDDARQVIFLTRSSVSLFRKGSTALESFYEDK